MPVSPPLWEVCWCSSWTPNVRLISQIPQSTICIVYALFCGFREGIVGNYPPSAACLSPTTSSCRGEAVADKALFLGASLLGFLHDGVAGLASAVGSESSRSSSSLSRIKVSLRWRLWMVAKLLHLPWDQRELMVVCQKRVWRPSLQAL